MIFEFQFLRFTRTRTHGVRSGRKRFDCDISPTAFSAIRSGANCCFRIPSGYGWRDGGRSKITQARNLCAMTQLSSSPDDRVGRAVTTTRWDCYKKEKKKIAKEYTIRAHNIYIVTIDSYRKYVFRDGREEYTRRMKYKKDLVLSLKPKTRVLILMTSRTVRFLNTEIVSKKLQNTEFLLINQKKNWTHKVPFVLDNNFPP